MSDPRSRIPGVDALLGAEPVRPLVERFGRVRTVDALRAAVDGVRAEVAAAPEAWQERTGDPAEYADRAERLLERADVASLRPVINATGVVLHTNLGRAPLADEAIAAMRAAAGTYTNLEYDLDEGRRGSRYVHCVSLLTELTGAEDALVVNNAAGALVLALNTLALGRGVAVSRGELVEIGGGFRIPEVLERAGARLVEVGSTNRTRLRDYEGALAPADGPHVAGPEGPAEPVAAILKVHRSNFRITGFTEEAPLTELAGLAGRHGVPLVHDLGSGLLVEASVLGLPDEPRAVESLAAGADVVVVSGDKLLGGPQAGILLGSAEAIGRMRRNPLCRALRVDKGTLAGLEATLRLYRDPERVVQAVPTLAMLAADPAVLERRARALAARVGEAIAARIGEAFAADGDAPPEVAAVPTRGAVGGGTYPGVELDSWAVELRGGAGADALAEALRDGAPPVVGRVVDGGLRLDVRTVFARQEDDLVRRVVEAAGHRTR